MNPAVGTEMAGLIERLYPIHRSMTGDGVRETLAVLSEWLPIDVVEVASGSQVLDWTIPDEWNVARAWIKGPDGSTIVDLEASNLHVVAHSVPVQASMSLDELQPHLHSLPDDPEAIPYRTGYFGDDWGFCLSDRRRRALEPGDYEVMIDGTLEPGSLTYGECVIEGSHDREILLSAHVCHPSLVNDNLSGIAVAAAVGRELRSRSAGRFGVRIVFVPATIGSIAWLDRNPDAADRVAGGLTLVNLSNGAPLTYKRTVDGNRRIDRVASQIISGIDDRARIIDYYPFGYDERQYNSPGFRLPVGSLMRSRHGEYDAYHTSRDDLSMLDADHLADAADAVLRIVDRFQTGRVLRNLSPRGEPRLGTRGLYTPVRNEPLPKEQEYAYLWILNLGDGEHDLEDIVHLSGLPASVVDRAAEALIGAGLVEEVV